MLFDNELEPFGSHKHKRLQKHRHLNKSKYTRKANNLSQKRINNYNSSPR